MGSSGPVLSKGPPLLSRAAPASLVGSFPTFKLQVAQDLKVRSSARQQGALFLLLRVLCESGTILIEV